MAQVGGLENQLFDLETHVARLRVGDIVIEDGSVSLGGSGAEGRAQLPLTQSQFQTQTQTLVLPPPLSLRRALGGIPGPPRVLATLGGLLLVCGLAAVWLGRSSYAGPPFDAESLGWLLAGLPATVAGVGVVGLAAAKHLLLAHRPPVAPTAQVHQAQEAVAESGATDLFEARMAKLRPHLSLADPGMSFERLLSDTGLTERALLETLLWGEEHKLVQENLNLESGEWYYELGSESLDAAPQRPPPSLEDRRRALSARDKEKS